MTPKTLKAELALIAITIIWGTTFPLTKYLGATMDPVTLLFYRFLFAAILLGLTLVFKRKNLFEDLKAGLILGILLWLVFICQMVGLRDTTASNSGFITGLFVVTVPICAFAINREVPTPAQSVGAVLALIGLWLITGGITSANRGDVITLGTAVSCGFYIVLAEPYTRRAKNIFVLTFQQFFVCAVLSGLYALVTGLSFGIPSGMALIFATYLAIFATLLCVSVQMWAQQHTSPIRATLIFALEPVVAAVLAWAFLGELFSFWQAVGGALILLAMVWSAGVSPAKKWVALMRARRPRSN